jgi:anti-anti-sigma factor
MRLSGELDLQCLPELRTILRAALSSRRWVLVDLSEVTFLDALCLLELAVQYQLHSNSLVLWRPSPAVKLTLAICELEEWVNFHPEREAALRFPPRPVPMTVVD